MSTRWRGTALAGSLILLLTGCGSPAPHASPSAPVATVGSPAPASAATPVPTSVPTRPPGPRPGTVPPPWLGTRPLPLTSTGYGEIRPTPPGLRNRRFTVPDSLPALPGDDFASRVVSPPPAAVLARSTWQPGCPIASADLAWVRLTFRGFDGARHTGELLVADRVADDVVTVFDDLWKVGFPLEEMRITTTAELDAAPTGDGDDTGGFVCRPVAGTADATTAAFSQHAFGLAIDVNPFQNPFTDPPLVLPELASSYLDRMRVRPGMITPDSTAVRAFTSIGWTWGGTWRTKQDFQHFSLTGG